MLAIQQGATEVIYLTAINENNEVAKDEIANMSVDILIVQKNDVSKAIHKPGVIDASNGVIKVELSAEDTALISGYANLEVRDVSNGVIIATKANAFDFRHNEIHKYDATQKVVDVRFQVYATTFTGGYPDGYVRVGHSKDLVFSMSAGYSILLGQFAFGAGTILYFLESPEGETVDQYTLSQKEIEEGVANIVLSVSAMTTSEMTTSEMTTSEMTTSEMTTSEMSTALNIDDGVSTSNLEQVVSEYEQE